MSSEERALRGARDRTNPPTETERAELQRQADDFTKRAERWLARAEKIAKPMQALQILNASIKLLAEANKLREYLERSPRRAPEPTDPRDDEPPADDLDAYGRRRPRG